VCVHSVACQDVFWAPSNDLSAKLSSMKYTPTHKDCYERASKVYNINHSVLTCQEKARLYGPKSDDLAWHPLLLIEKLTTLGTRFAELSLCVLEICAGYCQVWLGNAPPDELPALSSRMRSVAPFASCNTCQSSNNASAYQFFVVTDKGAILHTAHRSPLDCNAGLDGGRNSVLSGEDRSVTQKQFFFTMHPHFLIFTGCAELLFWRHKTREVFSSPLPVCWEKKQTHHRCIHFTGTHQQPQNQGTVAPQHLHWRCKIAIEVLS